MSENWNWTLTPEEDWEPIPVFYTGDTQPKFVSAGQSSDRILVRYFFNPKTREGWGHVRLGPDAQGPPGHVHGGCSAAIMDETMGLSAWMNEIPVVAKEIRIRYRRPTPLWTELVLHSWIISRDGRNVEIGGEIRTPEGEVCVSSTGTFVEVDADRLSQLTKAGEARRKAAEENEG